MSTESEKYMALRPSVAKLLSDLPLANEDVVPEDVVGAIQKGLAEVGTPRFVLCHGLTFSRYVLPNLRSLDDYVAETLRVNIQGGMFGHFEGCGAILGCSRLLPENTVWVVGDTTYTISILG